MVIYRCLKVFDQSKNKKEFFNCGADFRLFVSEYFHMPEYNSIQTTDIDILGTSIQMSP